MKISAKLFANDEAEARVRLDAGFLDRCPIYRADVLQDWIFQLEKLYDQTLDEVRLTYDNRGVPVEKH